MRLNPLTGRWVTIVAERAERPTDFAPRTVEVEADPSRPCPFCPGNEEKTLPALEEVDAGGSWQLRVVPNLYPAFDGDDPFAVHHLGPVHVMAEASGIHEVFVYTPDHFGGIHLADDHKMAEIMQAMKRRLAEHANTPNIRYTQAILNHGREAGASLSHPHGQLLGLPIVPGEMLEEERAFARFESACILCATVEAEITDGKRVVFASEDALCISPFWAGSPYELLI
ncbi:MAG TPA: galactose-1-phosphate uridylyltransferase, partial [Acidimicrobiia bacterium]|nr:galactose-1-phosphate uridylyltransferase [Acidimicrobiia bacterium]